MALEYRVVLAAGTAAEEVAQRAIPDAADRWTGSPSFLSVALWDRYGFELTVRSGREGYVEIEVDGGIQVWEPESYVSLTFRMDKDADPDWNVPNMLTVVRRVLASGAEDAAFTFDIDILLLTRFKDVIVKFDRDWWASSAEVDQLVACVTAGEDQAKVAPVKSRRPLA
ncbi:SitI3 family protein [Actinoplanes sp. NPDC049548]|uniref:SitI3 family protein n=1 Tax=Actinoplanes sp. NPDC049548 TaxID=3155152 RepID=UPI00341B39BE